MKASVLYLSYRVLQLKRELSRISHPEPPVLKAALLTNMIQTHTLILLFLLLRMMLMMMMLMLRLLLMMILLLLSLLLMIDRPHP